MGAEEGPPEGDTDDKHKHDQIPFFRAQSLGPPVLVYYILTSGVDSNTFGV